MSEAARRGATEAAMTLANSSIRINRRFVSVGGQHLHYRRGGSGPPIVMVHPAITSSTYFVPQMTRLAEKFTCFAFDNPGFGSSDTTPGSTGLMAELADGIAAGMRALGFHAVPVFGYHTGAAVALELAARHPDLVSGLVLDGLPMFNQDEVAQLFSADFAPPLTIDALGGHLTHTWTRFRDQYTFYPWCTKTAHTVLPLKNAATAPAVNDWVQYFYSSAEHYAVPFFDAHDSGAVAAERITSLTMPALFVCASNDFLVSHTPRLPALNAQQELALIGPEPAEKNDVINNWLDRYSSVPPADAPAPGASVGIGKYYVDLPSGQMLVRLCGALDAAPLLLIHDAPGSAQVHEALIVALGRHHRVLAVDLPGCGESDPLPDDARTLADYAAAMRAACRALGVARATVVGVGFGASLAVELAGTDDGLVARLVLHGLLLPTPEERADMMQHFAPPLAVGEYGEHWYRVWLMLRDSLIYFPWYRRTGAALRKIDADFDGVKLHRRTFEVVKKLGAYHHVIEAALGHDLAAALLKIKLPMLALCDRMQPFSAYAAARSRLLPELATLPAAAGEAALAEQIAGFTSAPHSTGKHGSV